MGQLGCSTGTPCASDFGHSKYHMNIVKVDRSLVDAAAVAAAAARADAEQRHWQEEWLRRGLAELEQQREAAMAQRRSQTSSASPSRDLQRRHGGEQCGNTSHQIGAQQPLLRSAEYSPPRRPSWDANATGMLDRHALREERHQRPTEELQGAAHEQRRNEAALSETRSQSLDEPGAVQGHSHSRAVSTEVSRAESLDANLGAVASDVKGSPNISLVVNEQEAHRRLSRSSPVSEHGLQFGVATLKEAGAEPALPASSAGDSRASSRHTKLRSSSE